MGNREFNLEIGYVIILVKLATFREHGFDLSTTFYIPLRHSGLKAPIVATENSDRVFTLRKSRIGFFALPLLKSKGPLSTCRLVFLLSINLELV